MKIRAGSYFLILIIIIALVAIILSLRMEYFSSKLLPLIVSGTILVLAAIELVREQLKPTSLETSAAEGNVSTRAETENGWRGYLSPGGWVAGFVLSIFLLGFTISIALFAFSYLKSQGTRWVTAIAFAIITTVVCYVPFELLMGFKLYRGLVFIQLFR